MIQKTKQNVHYPMMHIVSSKCHTSQNKSHPRKSLKKITNTWEIKPCVNKNDFETLKKRSPPSGGYLIATMLSSTKKQKKQFRKITSKWRKIYIRISSSDHWNICFLVWLSDWVFGKNLPVEIKMSLTPQN